MNIKDILMVLRAGDPCDARLAIGGGLARAHRAHVTGYWMIEPPPLELADSFARGPRAVNAVIDHRDAAIAAKVAKTRSEFEAALAGACASYGWKGGRLYEAPEAIVDQSRTTDLVIVQRPEPHDRSAAVLLQELLLYSGSPCLSVPEGIPTLGGFERVVVAWNGARASKRALSDGLVLMQGAKSVSIVIVQDRATDALPPDSDRALLRHLEHHGIRADVRRLACAASGEGATILAACGDMRADLLIMGAFGRSPSFEKLTGGVTQTVMTHAALPVLLSR